MCRWSLALALLGCSSHAPGSPASPDAPGAVDAPVTPEDPIAGVQMNDVSVLLPLATTQADFATYLTATSPAANGALFPEALFTNDQDDGPIAYGALRVVAFRFDPCFAHLGPITDPAACDNQLRLVFQPLAFADGATTAGDAAVHVSYALTREQLFAAVREVVAARAEATTADLGPLAVHPVVATQGLAGPLAQRLLAIVASYADAAKVERFTSFVADPTQLGPAQASPPDDPTMPVFWQFHGVDVADGVASPLLIPTTGGAVGISLNASTMPLESIFGETTTSPDNIDVLASADQAAAATPAVRQAAFDAALRVENPAKNSPNTIDCVTCHMAEPARVLVGQMTLGLTAAGDPNAFAADPSVPSADLGTTTQLVDADGGLDIHAFSYRAASPMINQRVVDESAVNVGYLAAP